MNRVEEAVYLRMFDRFESPVPTGILYVKTPVDVCYERIRIRGRPGEEAIDKKYLQLIHDSHEQWLNNQPNVLEIDGLQDFSTAMEKIRQFIR